MAPLHNPANLQGYRACLEIVGPDIPQVAVFDTAFHSTMPAKAYMYAVPYEYYEKYGVRRYGFHGTSHKFVSHRVAEKMGKKPVEYKTDTPGFIVNRCLFAFMLEAIHCYEDGVATVDDIDTAIKFGLNHPLGPFEMMDMSGLDTFPHVTETMEALPVTTWKCPESVKKLVAEGKYGRKSGEGWHKYN